MNEQEKPKLNSRGDRRGMNSKLITNPEIRGKDKAKLNLNQKEEMLTNIVKWITDGYSNPDIIQMILNQSPVPLSEGNARTLIYDATHILEHRSLKDADLNIAIHHGMYEHWYKYFKSIKHTAGMNKVMAAQAKLNKLGSTETLTVNENTTVILEKTTKIDETKLTEEERKRFIAVHEKLQKAKKIEKAE